MENHTLVSLLWVIGWIATGIVIKAGFTCPRPAALGWAGVLGGLLAAGFAFADPLVVGLISATVTTIALASVADVRASVTGLRESSASRRVG